MESAKKLAEWLLCIFIVSMATDSIKAQITDGCGTSKGCYRSPPQCTGISDCDFFASWTVDSIDSNDVKFVVTGMASTYVALGFSTTASMANTEVYACTNNTEVRRSQNAMYGYNNHNAELKGVSNVTVSVVDGRLRCEFTRQAFFDGDSTFTDLRGSNSYYVIMAKSNGNLKPDGNIDQHDGRVAGSTLMTFSQYISSATAAPTMSITMVTQPMPDGAQITDGCGTSKGCYRSPPQCTGISDCDFFASWTVDSIDSNDVKFVVTGMASTYVALGFSTTASMTNTEVYACTNNNEVRRSQNANYGTTNHNAELKGVSNVTVSVVDGRLRCDFTRQTFFDGDSTFTDLRGSNSYYVIMAKSNGNLQPDGNINQHDGRVAGSVLMSFSQFLSSATAAPTMEATMVTMQDRITDGCGTSKGCYRSPTQCTGISDCDFFASWTVDSIDSNDVKFVVTGMASTYVALGFSTTQGTMTNTEVYACTNNNEVRRSQNANYGYTNHNADLKGVSNVTVSVVDGRLRCDFTRQAFFDGDSTFTDLRGSNSYYVIMAKSNGNLQPDGNINQHDGRVAGSMLMSFSQFLSSATAAPTMGVTMGTQPGGVMTTQPMQSGGPITSDGCDTTKGCFQSPSGCTGSNCDYFLSWRADTNRNHVFEMTGKANGYVAFGLSKSGKMSNSDVYACTKNNEVVRSRNTDGNTNDPTQILKGVSSVTVSIIDGRIECRFTRQASLNDRDSTYYNLKGQNKYTIIMAKANGGLQADGNIMIHSGRVQSGGQTSFNAFTSAEMMVSNERMLQKTHGCFMIIAWIGLASIGLTMARFFKPMWPNSKPGGKPVWFTIHRICMMLTFLCTILAFIIIFIAAGSFLAPSEGRSGFAHAILGTIVTILAIVNPIMAIFRPHPGEPKRNLFNWAHWAVGTSAHVISMVTICLGVGIGSARPLISGLPSFTVGIVITFMICHFIIWIIFEIKKRNIMMKNSDSADDISLEANGKTPEADGVAKHTSQEELHPSDDNKTPASKDSSFMSILFFVYLIIVIVIVATVVITIGTA